MQEGFIITRERARTARRASGSEITVTVTKIAAATRARPPYATTRTPPCRAQPWDGVCWRLRNGYGYEDCRGHPGAQLQVDLVSRD